MPARPSTRPRVCLRRRWLHRRDHDYLSGRGGAVGSARGQSRPQLRQVGRPLLRHRPQPRFSTIITIDGDGQDEPERDPGPPGRARQGRRPGLGVETRPPRSGRPPARVPHLLNRVTRRPSPGSPIDDMNCGFKAYRGECARSLEIYGEMHRFIPVLAAQQGWPRRGGSRQPPRARARASSISAPSASSAAPSTCSPSSSSAATPVPPAAPVRGCRAVADARRRAPDLFEST